MLIKKIHKTSQTFCTGNCFKMTATHFGLGSDQPLARNANQNKPYFSKLMLFKKLFTTNKILFFTKKDLKAKDLSHYLYNRQKENQSKSLTKKIGIFLNTIFIFFIFLPFQP